MRWIMMTVFALLVGCAQTPRLVSGEQAERICAKQGLKAYQDWVINSSDPKNSGFMGWSCR